MKMLGLVAVIFGLIVAAAVNIAMSRIAPELSEDNYTWRDNAIDWSEQARKFCRVVQSYEEQNGVPEDIRTHCDWEFGK